MGKFTKRKKDKGFTLIELIIIIAIMAILVGVFAPVLYGYIEKARQAKMRRNFEELSHMVSLYYVDIEKDNAFDGRDRRSLVINTGAHGSGAVVDLALTAHLKELFGEQFNEYSAYIEWDDKHNIVHAIWTFAPAGKNKKYVCDTAGDGTIVEHASRE